MLAFTGILLGCTVVAIYFVFTVSAWWIIAALLWGISFATAALATSSALSSVKDR
jgi:hypothetical protein